MHEMFALLQLIFMHDSRKYISSLRHDSLLSIQRVMRCFANRQTSLNDLQKSCAICVFGVTLTYYQLQVSLL